jgi:hypothetical protein
MPSANDASRAGTGGFAEFARRNPVALVGSGAIIGGALVAVLIINADGRGSTPQPTQTATIVETTGRAAPAEPSGRNDSKSADASTTADCGEQTWPYIARPCLANDAASKRGVRVISTDRLSDPVIGTIQAPPEAVANRRVAADDAQRELPPMIQPIARSEPPTASAAAPSPTPAAASTEQQAANQHPRTPPAAPRPTEAAVVSKPSEPVIASATPAQSSAAAPARSSAPPPQQRDPDIALDPDASSVKAAAAPASVPQRVEARGAGMQRAAFEPQTEAAPEKPARTSRNAKKSRSRDVADRDSRRQPRIVERWTEREYEVRGGGMFGQSRRVIVIQRNDGSRGYGTMARIDDD